MDKAIADCTEAIKLKPNFFDPYLWRGALYKDLGKYSDAIADLTEAARLKPENDTAYYHLGNVYCRVKQYSEATRRHLLQDRLEYQDHDGSSDHAAGSGEQAWAQ